MGRPSPREEDPEIFYGGNGRGWYCIMPVSQTQAVASDDPRIQDRISHSQRQNFHILKDHPVAYDIVSICRRSQRHFCRL